MIILSSISPVSALNLETISRRDLVIDLGDGLTTDAQLTYPSVGEGPFPGVLLVHGSGNTDMDEYLPPEISDTENGSRPFLQIAEYLSERGFAVLRYNKRGIGLKGTVLNEEIVVNITFENLLEDAEKALEALLGQPEVDVDDITILGHSEGTWIAPRIAIRDSRVKNIVLMSAAAHNLYDILYFQIVEQGIRTFEEIDSNNDGLLSVQEVTVLQPIMKNSLVENGTGEWQWLPGIDPNGDGYISLIDERLPLWNQTFEYITTADYPGSIWIQSHFDLEKNLDLIDDVPASVLILQGEEDTQTPVSEALLLEQRLTEAGHPDHTLITYTGLGHTFYPKEGLLQWLGPIQDNVLYDLADWLNDPARDVHNLDMQLETAINMAESLKNKIDELNSELDQQTISLENQINELRSESTTLLDTIADLEGHNQELQSALDAAKNLTYVAIGVATISAIALAVIIFQKRYR